MAAAFLTFRAAGERFAVPIERVREAARARRIVPLPGAPSAYAGVAIVRGEPLGVLDLGRVAAARGPLPEPGRSVLVVLRGEARALLVDRVDGVERLDVAAEEGQTGWRRSGPGDARGPLSLIDLDALFAGEEGQLGKR